MKRQYFPRQPDDPPALRSSISRQVRFEEVDPLGIVWHGRYASFFDDARVALGDAYGMGYLDFLEHEVVTPIRRFHVDHMHPLSYPELFTVEALLHWTEAARLDYEFIVRDGSGRVAATGYTVQLILDRAREVLMVPPTFLVEIRDRWKTGTLEKVHTPSEGRTKLAERISGH